MYRQHYLPTTGWSAVAAARRRWSRRMLVAVAACVLGLLPGIPSLAPSGPAVVQAAPPDQPRAAAPAGGKGTQAPCAYLPFSGPTWMHDIAVCLQSRKLRDIVIPGSHDSATYGFAPGQGLDIATTQDVDFFTQLNAGMRQLDIRVEKHDGDSGPGFYAHHGSGITDVISDTLTLALILSEISTWAALDADPQEIVMLNLTIDPPGSDDYADCFMFGQQMGGALVTPQELLDNFGTTDPGQVTLGQLWSLPGSQGIARVIMDNIPCLEEAIVGQGGGGGASPKPADAQWGPFSPPGQTLYSGYYADQGTADGLQQYGNQQVGLIKMVLPAAEHGYTLGSNLNNSLPQPFGPPKVGGLYVLSIQGTPEAAPPFGPSVPSWLVTPKSMLPDEQKVLQALFDDPAVAAGRSLNVISGDFVEQTGLLGAAMSWDQHPLPPDAPEITGLTSGDGQVTVAFVPPKSYGTDPITSYTVTATDETNPRSGGAQGQSSPTTVKGLNNGDTYDITVTATSISGTSPPSAPGEITLGVPPKFVSGPAANLGVVGYPYSSGFGVIGTPPPTVTLVSGDLPPGLTLYSDGNLTGTPTKAGSYTFTVQAANPLDAAKATATVSVSGDVSAEMLFCTPQGGNAYGCLLQVGLGAPLALNTVFSVFIGGAVYPSDHDSPQVAYFMGCQVAPLLSPYLAVNGNYTRYDVNISSGGCARGTVVVFEEAVTGAAGATITQSVTVPGLGTGTVTFGLP